MYEIDHVVAVVDALDSAADRLLDRYGLASVPGGRHPGHGTGNRIIPLGGSYLELMAVLDPAEADGSPLGRWARDRATDELRISAVCLRTGDIGPVAAALGEEPLSMSRETPDGRRLSWRLAGLGGMLRYGSPFFIQWDTGDHPGAAAADHRVAPRGITRVGVTDAPNELLGILRTTPGVVLGSPRLSATIRTADGSIDL